MCVVCSMTGLGCDCCVVDDRPAAYLCDSVLCVYVCPSMHVTCQHISLTMCDEHCVFAEWVVCWVGYLV